MAHFHKVNLVALTYSCGDPGSEFPVRFHAHAWVLLLTGTLCCYAAVMKSRGGTTSSSWHRRDQGGDALGRFPKDSPLLAAVEVLEASLN